MYGHVIARQSKQVCDAEKQSNPPLCVAHQKQTVLCGSFIAITEIRHHCFKTGTISTNKGEKTYLNCVSPMIYVNIN